MEQRQVNIQEVILARTVEKLKSEVGSLSGQLAEMSARADILQELYNSANEELNKYKGKEQKMQELQTDKKKNKQK